MRFKYLLTLLILFSELSYSSGSDLCIALKRYVSTVEPNEGVTLQFQTVWGGNFKDTKEEAVFAKRCIHNDTESGKAVCSELLESGSVEFQGNNVKRILQCLSPETSFAKGVFLESVKMNFVYGTEEKGSIVYLKLGHEESVGGMVLEIEVSGY